MSAMKEFQTVRAALKNACQVSSVHIHVLVRWGAVDLAVWLEQLCGLVLLSDDTDNTFYASSDILYKHLPPQ